MARAVWIEISGKVLALCFTTVLLSGCLGNKESILPQDGPTMLEVYDQHFTGSSDAGLKPNTAERKSNRPLHTIKFRPLHSGNRDLHGYTRSAHDEIESVFTRLPNPTLILYVYPHLTSPGGHPVPGYTTAFPFYESTEYALPGEASGAER